MKRWLFILCLLIPVLAGAQVFRAPAFYGAAKHQDAAGGGGGSITYVRGTGAQSTDGNSVSASFASTPTAGNTVIVAVAAYDEDLVNGDVTDNQGNTYTIQVSTNIVLHTSSAFFVCNNVAASGTFTVTFSPGTATYPALHISEWSNVNNTTVVTDSKVGRAAGTSASTASITSPTSGYVLAMTTHDDGGSPTITPAGGWTNPYEAETSSGNSLPISLLYKSSSTSETPSWTIGSSVEWTAAAIAIQP